ncbi:MAG: carotenoid biosynthesis protein [Brumimicrobium sp.]
MIKAPAFQEYYQRYKTVFLILLLIIFYSVGVVGLSSDSREYFLGLSFMNLGISFAIILLARVQHDSKFYLFVIGGFFIGMVAEWIGIHTSLLFGEYTYGENLGSKWYGVPIIIGINWVMLTMISASILKTTKLHWALKALGGAILMLVLDLLLEPVAIVSDYWVWEEEIPTSNFIDWFIIAFFLQLWYFRFNLAEPNKVAIALYIIQIVFFTILNLV